MMDISVSESTRVLRNNYNGYLSYIADEKPYVIPITYFFDAETYLGASTQWGLMVIYLFAMWKAGTEARQENGGFISFREVIKPIFLSAVISSIIVIVFQYIFIILLIRHYLIYKGRWQLKQ